MVQGKKQLNSKPKFAEVVIGDNEANEMRESANVRNHRNPYLKLSYPNGVTLILPADISIEQLRAYISITAPLRSRNLACTSRSARETTNFAPNSLSSDVVSSEL